MAQRLTALEIKSPLPIEKLDVASGHVYIKENHYNISSRCSERPPSQRNNVEADGAFHLKFIDSAPPIMHTHPHIQKERETERDETDQVTILLRIRSTTIQRNGPCMCTWKGACITFITR